MLYVLSGGLNAEGFVFATLIDRPFVAPTMATLWYFGALPGPLALLLAIEDSVARRKVIPRDSSTSLGMTE